MSNLFEKVLIFGGTGSLGTMIIQLWAKKVGKFIVYSRDEYKQWASKQLFPSLPITYVLGDVFNKEKVQQTILTHNPTLIIVASAMKHVDRCEFDARSCLQTNCLGFLNIIETVNGYCGQLNLHKLIFVSTDKACSPVNIYGMSKSICEHIVQTQDTVMNKNNQPICMAVVRYGNVISSNGSIIPLLQKQANDNSVSNFTITDEKMTRFYMTLPDSVNLIEDSVNYAEHGEIWIPKLNSMRILDLINIFSARYNKPVKNIGIRPGEKIHEALISDMESLRVIEKNNRLIIGTKYNGGTRDFLAYSSDNNLLSKDELQHRLSSYLGINPKYNIVVLGQTGMLGRYIFKYFQNRSYNVITIDRPMFNISAENITELPGYIDSLLENICDVVIINCIGKTNKVNASEDEYTLINSKLPQLLYKLCVEREWKFIQPSTDCVFAGTRPAGQSYNETDLCDNKDVYGLSKLNGECGLVIRASIIGKQLTYKTGLYEVVCNSKVIDGFSNHYWNGITCLEYAKVIEQIMVRDLWWIGVRHIVPDYTVSKLQLIQAIKKANNLELEIRPKQVTPVNRKLSTIYTTNITIANLDQQLNELKDFSLE